MKEMAPPVSQDVRQTLTRMLRVNHAGEYGAVRIYQGQHDILKDTPSGPTIDHMKAQEETHRALFSDLIAKHQVRPTALSPLWHVAGYAMGAISGLLGKKAAMACTVAVEEVIDSHYQSQRDQLAALKKQGKISGPAIDEIEAAIIKCHAEELEHRDIGIEEKAREMKGYTPFTKAIKHISKTAIWLSTRF